MAPQRGWLSGQPSSNRHGHRLARVVPAARLGRDGTTAPIRSLRAVDSGAETSWPCLRGPRSTLLLPTDDGVSYRMRHGDHYIILAHALGVDLDALRSAAPAHRVGRRRVPVGDRHNPIVLRRAIVQVPILGPAVPWRLTTGRPPPDSGRDASPACR